MCLAASGADVDFDAVVSPGSQENGACRKGGGDDFSNAAITDADDDPYQAAGKHEAARNDVALMEGHGGGIDGPCHNDQPSDRIFGGGKNSKKCDDNKGCEGDLHFVLGPKKDA